MVDEGAAPTTPRRVCASCGEEARLKCRCGTRYCSKACQAEAWPEHRKACTRRLVAAETARDRTTIVPKPPPAARRTRFDAAPPVRTASAPAAAPRPAPDPAAAAVEPAADADAADADAADADAADADAADADADAAAAAIPSAPPCPLCAAPPDPNRVTSLLLCCGRDVCAPCGHGLLEADRPCPLCDGAQPATNAASLSRLKALAKTDAPAALLAPRAPVLRRAAGGPRRDAAQVPARRVLRARPPRPRARER